MTEMAEMSVSAGECSCHCVESLRETMRAVRDVPRAARSSAAVLSTVS